jgi:hypothetical protein
MGYWYELMVEEERRRNEMTRAEAWRRRRLMDGDSVQLPVSARILSFAGRWLESAGRQLRHRYEPAPASSVISRSSATPPCG